MRKIEENILDLIFGKDLKLEPIIATPIAIELAFVHKNKKSNKQEEIDYDCCSCDCYH